VERMMTRAACAFAFSFFVKLLDFFGHYFHWTIILDPRFS
jgi:hypothetical protein